MVGEHRGSHVEKRHKGTWTCFVVNVYAVYMPINLQTCRISPRERCKCKLTDVSVTFNTRKLMDVAHLFIYWPLCFSCLFWVDCMKQGIPFSMHFYICPPGVSWLFLFFFCRALCIIFLWNQRQFTVRGCALKNLPPRLAIITFFSPFLFSGIYTKELNSHSYWRVLSAETKSYL